MTTNPLVEALREKIAAARKTADDIRYYSGGSQRNHHAEELAEYLMNCAGDDLLTALASSAPATGDLERELERGLTRIARSNLRHYLNAAQFKCEADRTAALSCLDVLEEEIDGLSDLVAVLRSYHAAEDRLAALSSAPATGEREQIVAWQDIASAPKNWEPVLVWGVSEEEKDDAEDEGRAPAYQMMIARHSDIQPGNWWLYGGSMAMVFAPTHWQPLPEPPADHLTQSGEMEGGEHG